MSDKEHESRTGYSILLAQLANCPGRRIIFSQFHQFNKLFGGELGIFRKRTRRRVYGLFFVIKDKAPIFQFCFLLYFNNLSRTN